MSALRLAALEQWEAWQRMGVLYEWNGDLRGNWPDVRLGYGLDCSGFVVAGILVATQGKVDGRDKWSADWFHHQLEVTATPKPGDLAVYGTPEKSTHVMVVVENAAGRVLGACGGDQETVSKEIAMSRGARVRYRPRADYRFRLAANGMRVSAFLGFRINKFLDTP